MTTGRRFLEIPGIHGANRLVGVERLRVIRVTTTPVPRSVL